MFRVSLLYKRSKTNLHSCVCVRGGRGCSSRTPYIFLHRKYWHPLRFPFRNPPHLVSQNNDKSWETDILSRFVEQRPSKYLTITVRHWLTVGHGICGRNDDVMSVIWALLKAVPRSRSLGLARIVTLLG